MMKEELFNRIEEANKLIKLTKIKSRTKDERGNWVSVENEYCEVKERVIAFKRVFPDGQIITEPTFTENYICFEAVILDNEGKILAKGHARENADRQFALEVAETSAIGRALGFAGFGITTSIASAEEIRSVNEKEIFDEDIIHEPKKSLVELVNEFKELFTVDQQIKILNGYGYKNIADLGTEALEKYIAYGKEQSNKG